MGVDWSEWRNVYNLGSRRLCSSQISFGKGFCCCTSSSSLYQEHVDILVLPVFLWGKSSIPAEVRINDIIADLPALTLSRRSRPGGWVEVRIHQQHHAAKFMPRCQRSWCCEAWNTSLHEADIRAGLTLGNPSSRLLIWTSFLVKFQWRKTFKDSRLTSVKGL